MSTRNALNFTMPPKNYQKIYKKTSIFSRAPQRIVYFPGKHLYTPEKPRFTPLR